MSISKQVNEFVQKLPEGKIFTYDDIDIKNKATVAICLSRLFKSKAIGKISKGKFYKYKQSRFGKLPPSSIEIINAYVRKYNGYITGTFLYNITGLSTQVPAVIDIATNKSFGKINIENLRFKFISTSITITNKNKKFLQLLDIIKNIKKAPDVDINTVILYIIKELKNMKIDELEELVEISKKYRPMVRALLGAILENSGYLALSKKLKVTLNKKTSYKLGVSEKILPNANKWKIIGNRKI